MRQRIERLINDHEKSIAYKFIAKRDGSAGGHLLTSIYDGLGVAVYIQISSATAEQQAE